MRRLYNILTHVADFSVKLIGNFNHKLGLGVKGRKETFKKLEKHLSYNDKTFWFHCASLGEYEQGLPVFEEIKKKHPKHKIVLSFFSPSGYEIRKNTHIADCVVYLPLDTSKNAKKFLRLVHPDLAVFVKYEIWPNYLRELKNRNVHTILISALFQKDQVFFKPHGKWMLKYLKVFKHIFVQNEASLKLLKQYGFKDISISGDTRFDRVSNQLKVNNTLSFISEFKEDNLCLVAGSTWPEGEKLLIEYINTTEYKNVKFIIAPHNIKPKQIEKLKVSIKKPVVLFSEKEEKQLSDYHVFIVDTIGILSKIYSYANIAYVGGGLGTNGLHNTLEPAVFGVPIIIGNNFKNFPEAKDMHIMGGLYSITDQNSFNEVLNELIVNENHRIEAGKKAASYIKNNTGVVSRILHYLDTNTQI